MIFPIQIPKVHDLGCNGKAFAIETYFDGQGHKAVFLSSYSQIVAAYEPSTTAVYWYPVPKGGSNTTARHLKAFADYLGGGDLYERFKAAKNRSR